MTPSVHREVGKDGVSSVENATTATRRQIKTEKKRPKTHHISQYSQLLRIDIVYFLTVNKTYDSENGLIVRLYPVKSGGNEGGWSVYTVLNIA